jgi:hypothetical protein
LPNYARPWHCWWENEKTPDNPRKHHPEIVWLQQAGYACTYYPTNRCGFHPH